MSIVNRKVSFNIKHNAAFKLSNRSLQNAIYDFLYFFYLWLSPELTKQHRKLIITQTNITTLNLKKIGFIIRTTHFAQIDSTLNNLFLKT